MSCCRGGQEQLPTHSGLSALGTLIVTSVVVVVVAAAVLLALSFFAWKSRCCRSPGEHRVRGTPGAGALCGCGLAGKSNHSTVFIFQETGET